MKLFNNCLTKQKEEVLAPLLVPEGVVFRPRKQDVEQLQQRDFLGKAKVKCLYGEFWVCGKMSLSTTHLKWLKIALLILLIKLLLLIERKKINSDTAELSLEVT